MEDETNTTALSSCQYRELDDVEACDGTDCGGCSNTVNPPYEVGRAAECWQPTRDMPVNDGDHYECINTPCYRLDDPAIAHGENVGGRTAILVLSLFVCPCSWL